MFNFFKKFLNKLKPAPILNVGCDIGDKNLPTIVLLHGIAARSGAWNQVIEGIKNENCRIVTLDLLGFGDSPRPKNCDYKVEDQIKSIRSTIKRLAIKKPFYLVGHSMGSIISARYIRNYPSDVTQAILFSLPLYFKNSNSSKKTLVDIANDAYMKAYDQLIANPSFTIKYSQQIRNLLKLENSLEINEDNWEIFTKSLKNTIMNQDTFEDIRHSQVPIWVIYGAMDEFLIQKNLDRLAVFNNVKLEKIPALNHSINERYAQIIVERIKQMLVES